MNAHKADYQREYRHRPEVKAMMARYAKKQYQRPEVRERDRVGHKLRYHTPTGKAKYRAYELRKKYGITPENLQRLLEAQKAVCAVAVVIGAESKA